MLVQMLDQVRGGHWLVGYLVVVEAGASTEEPAVHSVCWLQLS